MNNALRCPNNAPKPLSSSVSCFDRVIDKYPLQNGTGDTAALVVTTFDALCLSTRSLGRLDDGLGDGSSSATRAVSVDERGGAASHFGSVLVLTVGRWGRVWGGSTGGSALATV